MTTKEYDLELSNEIIRSQELNELTDEIKELFINFIWSISELKKYSNLNEEDLKLCEAFAFKKCCDSVLTFDKEKLYKLYQYFNQLIKCSYASTIHRLAVTRKQTNIIIATDES
jgi:hypothetical protein